MHAVKRLLTWTLPVLLAASAFAATAAEDASVNVYSARKEVLIRPLLDRFTEETGIEVNLLSAGSGALLSRLQNEGRNTPADVLITVDAGNLHRAREAGVLQPVSSDTLDEAVPDSLRDPEGYWYGLSQRARVIFYARDRVEPDALTTYEDLADERWDDRLCIRSSNNIYNQSLVASMIAHKGEEATQRWAEGLVENFARSPQGGDTDQILAVAAGECDVAVANTYYFGRLLKGDDRRAEMARQVGIVFPNQQGRGTHVNVSGGGVTRHARHPDNAVRLLEFLLRPESQKWYAEVNNEYPVRPGVEASAVLREWGGFEADELNLSKLGEYNGEAVRLMDRVGWR
ncbi:Fe(3+) ABC transporter substrate-binding protein [Arhodomonas sp. AD133]|uniref:Fe(3+) ABC transporter substrate-binding protein n=1 Tax=Arhodomonas sp. AD133 TaxID=3415009 RepID=UPI003EBFF86B